MVCIMSRADLVNMAKEKQIPYYGSKTKKELCEALGLEINKIGKPNEKPCYLVNDEKKLSLMA